MEYYTKKHIAEATGLPLRAIQFYTESNIVPPEIESQQGRGNVRKYSRKNLLQFGVINVLHKKGLTLSKVKLLMEKLDGEDAFRDGIEGYAVIPDEIEDTYVLVKGEKGESDEIAILFSHQMDVQGLESVLIINLGLIYRNL